MTTAFTVDPWDPSYTAALNAEALADLDATSAQLDLDVELPAARWRPITPDPRTSPPDVLLIADGVRRIDARLWTYAPGDHAEAAAAPGNGHPPPGNGHPAPGGGAPMPGIAASCAAGIVRRTPGTPAEPVAVEVSRALFSASPHPTDIRTAAATYRARRAPRSGMDDLILALQSHLTQLEVDLAIRHRSEADADDLLLVDGPLRGRTHLPRTVGYIKTHHTAYLPAPQAGTVSGLGPGQRTPVFLMGTSWRRHAWYVRLPAPSGMPWAGVVRCEASADLGLDALVRLADSVTHALPPLAGVDYKDPRAPQNLVPIGGLERLLRHRLGDARVLYRALRAAAQHDAAARRAVPVR
ncbi:hypothetical protein [Nonomuraea gerenzanensis]|uniref:Single-stranded exonuclease associated with Rad50/Mre11 complex n=1 Tax=Nonomuraea gerenzanensis TaxID=93944 RepID=A0A1M4ECC1_9ACTN|nr:hypothetical protein [Nonomuraea gerenzanensis]UBU18559.1 hypothetical protein LCN96_27120 [Nonomuraea gerenzanensis]SBO96402.1 Single-stranded exonuclease associated with Rad50/Mre11 complex [Nonomuraea gerenzanensis]